MNLKYQQAVEERVRVALAGDCELVNAGLTAVLAAEVDRVHLVPVDQAQEVDVILFDPMLESSDGRSDLRRWTARGARVVLYSWDLEAAGRQLGQVRPDAQLSKSSTAAQIATCVERVCQDASVGDGSRALLMDLASETRVELTYREEEVLGAIVEGLSNDEICRRDYVTINTLKSHIRHLYRKIGVTRRSQAVLWGIQNGYATPARSRETPALVLAR